MATSILVVEIQQIRLIGKNIFEILYKIPDGQEW